MKIIIAGAGYVNLPNAMLLSQNYEVIAFDATLPKIEQLNNKFSPIVDTEIRNLAEEFSYKPSMSVKQGVNNE